MKLTNNGGDLSGQIACVHRHGELMALLWKVPMDKGQGYIWTMAVRPDQGACVCIEVNVNVNDRTKDGQHELVSIRKNQGGIS